MYILRRRFILERDPEVSWQEVIRELRSLGFGTSDICFTLNITHTLLWNWENEKSKPNFEHGRAVLKFLATLKVVKKSDTPKPSLAS